MRVLLVVVALALLGAGGCGMERQKKKAAEDKQISAARLDGKFNEHDPIVKMLGDDQRGALVRAGMLDEGSPEDLAGAEGDGADGDATDDEKKTDMEKAGDVMMSVLTVSITVGMMVAPYLLF